MKRRPSTRPLQQLDFWPELRNMSMTAYDRLHAVSAVPAPAHSGSEDGGRHGRNGAPLGIYGENAVTLPPSKGAKQ